MSTKEELDLGHNVVSPQNFIGMLVLLAAFIAYPSFVNDGKDGCLGTIQDPVDNGSMTVADRRAQVIALGGDPNCYQQYIQVGGNDYRT